MLMPKKVKYRKQQRGRRRGKAWRGGELSFGDYGLKVMEPAAAVKGTEKSVCDVPGILSLRSK